MSEIMGKRLKYLREKGGFQQKFVADKIGVKNNTLSGYESGNREPDSVTLTKLADFYEVTTDYLHGRTDDPKGYATENDEFNPLNEITKLAKKYGLEQLGFFDIEEWKNLGPEEIQLLDAQFKAIADMAKKRNEKK